MKKKKEDHPIQTFAFIITTIVALSGWGTIFHDWITSTPKIEGRVLSVISGEWHSDQFGNKPKTGIFVYLYLINKRKNPVHILDYELEFDTGGGYEKALRVYGTRNLPQPTFNSDEFEVSIPNFKDKLIYSKNTPIDYGTPVHGFALFVTDTTHDMFSNKLLKIRVTCIDAFSNKHVIEYNPKQVANIYLLNDIADIDIKKKTNNITGN